VDFGVFLSGFADVLRAQLTVVLNGKAEGVPASLATALRQRKDLFSAGDLLRMLGAVNALEPTFRKSSQQQLLIEMLLVRMALLDRTVALEDLLKEIGGTSSTPAPERPQSTGAPSRGPQSAAPSSRPAERPAATRPGYPPQLTAPNALPSGATVNKAQLQEMKRAMESTAQDSNRSRMTPEALREERIGMLRRKDPALGAAIDELDLELLD
jgi:DNA polymerase III gamma/tau subunit